MPVFDTQIHANDASLERILAQKLPVLVYLYDQGVEPALERIASTHAGKLLVVKIKASENPVSYARFERPALPAIIGLQGGEVKSKGSDIEAQVNYLLGQGEKPVEAGSQSGGVPISVPIHIQDASFQADVLNSPIPVLVDFWAPWCGPCKMIAPVLDKLAQQYAGRIKIAKLNVDENPVSAGRYQVRGIPQLMLFKNGQMIGHLVGAHPQQNIERLIQQGL